MIDLRVSSTASLKTLETGDIFIDADGIERTVTNVVKDTAGNVIIVEYS